MWSGNPYKNDVSKYAINFKKIIQQSPITILPMSLAGEFPYKIEVVFFFCWIQFSHAEIEALFYFAGFEGFFMGSDYGKSKYYGFRLWE